MADKPRNPLSINVPANPSEMTRYLVLSESEPLTVADSDKEAFAYCEALERAQQPDGVEFRWYLVNEADPDGPWEMVGFDGDEHQTGYTVTPITIRVGEAQAEMRQDGRVRADRLTSGVLVRIVSVADNAPLRIIDARPAHGDGRVSVTYEIDGQPGSTVTETFRSECLFTPAGGAA